MKTIILIISIGLCGQVFAAPTIDLKLKAALNKKSKINIVISLKESPATELKALEFQHFKNRQDKLQTFGKAYKVFTAKSQRHILEFLDDWQQRLTTPSSFEIISLWISNEIGVRGADLQLIEHLMNFPEIAKIEEEFILELDIVDLKIANILSSKRDDEFQWGVEQIEAPRVWNQGNTGSGVVVATIDTGVRLTHEALRENYVGDYGWYDPHFKTLYPNDTHGHGTHTTAIIAGQARNIGVAPGVKWASCKGCDGIFCSQMYLFVCGQWMACPSLANGTEPDCTKAPHVVSNSWGGGKGNTWYRSIIDFYHQVNIIPLFSAGNSGPDCGTVSSPADYENVIGVGATTVDNVVANFSSAGPTVIGERVKPDLAAPGSHNFSAYPSSDTAYAVMSGTSMACPHAAGVVALMLAENPDLTYAEVTNALSDGVVHTLATGMNCGGIPEDNYPNHHVGYGRLNAFNSVRMIRSSST